MTCIIVDDEILACEGFMNLCSGINELEVVAGFCDPAEALQYIKENRTDIVFLDISMPGMNGLELGKEIQKIVNPPQIVYITSYTEYAFEAFKVDALSYLLKPYDEQEIRHTLEKFNKRNDYLKTCKIYIRTFGNFDVFINGKLLVFAHPRAKELLAILVDGRGGFVSSGQIMNYMFDGKRLNTSLQVIYRKSRMYLKQILHEYQLDNLVLFAKGGCGLNISRIQCDYYDYIAGRPGAGDLFRGEYMNNYSWGENTLGTLMFDSDFNEVL
jgi:two-component SAPR family response regulator